MPLSPGWTLDHYVKIWSDPYTYVLVRNTLVFAVGSTASGDRHRAGARLLIERTDLPGRDLFAAAILMPMVTPPLLLAIGWVLILSPRIGIIPIGAASAHRTGGRMARHLQPARHDLSCRASPRCRPRC